MTLSASRDKKTAKEMLINGTARGVFTYSLVNTLRKSNGNLSYLELMNKVNLLVSGKVRDQSP
ncbi:MAG: caspase family protein, partial [Cyanobacteria bacterium J06636_16]